MSLIQRVFRKPKISKKNIPKHISNMCNTAIKDHKATNVSSSRLAPGALRISRSFGGAWDSWCVAGQGSKGEGKLGGKPRSLCTENLE